MCTAELTGRIGIISIFDLNTGNFYHVSFEFSLFLLWPVMIPVLCLSTHDALFTLEMVFRRISFY